MQSDTEVLSKIPGAGLRKPIAREGTHLRKGYEGPLPLRRLQWLPHLLLDAVGAILTSLLNTGAWQLSIGLPITISQLRTQSNSTSQHWCWRVLHPAKGCGES